MQKTLGRGTNSLSMREMLRNKSVREDKQTVEQYKCDLRSHEHIETQASE